MRRALCQLLLSLRISSSTLLPRKILADIQEMSSTLIRKINVSCFLLLTFLLMNIVSCSPVNEGAPGDLAAREEFVMAITLGSEAFSDGDRIPEKHTCDGVDVSPSLTWSDLPDGTISLALIMDDPDAPTGTWVHWVLYNLPFSSEGLAEGLSPSEELSGGGSQGKNSWNRIGYGGPCPPGGTHRYVFRLYALDITLDLQPEASKAELVQAMEGHILDKGQLLGLYSRS